MKAIKLAVAFLVVLAGSRPSIAAEPTGRTSLDPPVLLPDGREFKTWENPLAFARTYYVDQAHAQASDENRGTQDRPLRTIDRAAQLLQPGERAVVAAGVYRERVRPARGGTGPERMISYEAAPGAKVILSGSRVVTSPWSPSQWSPASSSARVWKTQLPKEFFPEGNPFGERNLTDAQIDRSMPWAVSTKGKPPNTLRRGLVFQSGRRLKQVARCDELRAAAGAYWVEEDGLTLHVRPQGDLDPRNVEFEVTTRDLIFAPAVFGLGYVRVKGFTIQHSGNCFPRPQQGALSAMRGHHWILEDNAVRQCNVIGIDVGDQFDIAGPKLAQGGQHIVRRNLVTDCGIGGIEGTGVEHTLIEENLICRCGWQRAQFIWETGGIKVHLTLGTLIRRNVIQDTIDGPGIWMDWQNRNSRCTQNVVLRTTTANGGIFMEASQVPNLVDHNVVWGTRGNGIYQHDCDELVVAHNLVVQSSDAGVRMQVCQGRQVGGRLSTAKRNKILNNILVGNGRPLAISDAENTIDYNVFGAGGTPFDLAAWQKQRGWDRHSAAAEVEVRLNPQTLELTYSARTPLPKCPLIPGLNRDFFGSHRPGPEVAAGPWAEVPPGARKVPLCPAWISPAVLRGAS